MTSTSNHNSPCDMELIAQRVLKLAEIATLEHLESLLRSQASDCLEGDWTDEQHSAANAA